MLLSLLQGLPRPRDKKLGSHARSAVGSLVQQSQSHTPQRHSSVLEGVKRQQNRAERQAPGGLKVGGGGKGGPRALAKSPALSSGSIACSNCRQQ